MVAVHRPPKLSGGDLKVADERIEERTGADVLVVGAGIIGLSCAWRAAEAGLETVVIDAGSDERASEVAAGMIAPVGEASWGEGDLLAAGVASAAAWPGFAKEVGAASGMDVPYRRCGALHVGLDRDEIAELRRVHELHVELGLEATWLRGSECRRLEPGLAPSVAGGFDVPGEAEVDPRAALRALRAAAVAAGVRIEDGARVVELLGDEGSVHGVRLEDGRRLAAERVVLATGARAGAELGAAGTPVPVRPVKGEIVRLRARPGERPCERLVVTERVYVVPRAGDEVVIGATVEERGFDRRVTAGGVHELLREAYRVLPEIAELEFVECAAGLRPGTPDNAPVIGATGTGGLLAAGGHHRNGILLAPITAETIAALLAGEEPPREAAPFAPGRLAAA
jgi:glycine oxidase